MKFSICILSIIALALSSSCKSDIQKLEKKGFSFNLKTDIYNFSNKLEENDTLILLVDASACTSFQHDSLVFVKAGKKIILHTISQNRSSEKETMNIGETRYVKTKDTLNFENLFQYVSNKNEKKRDGNSSVFTIHYKYDTIQFYSNNLVEHLDILNYYMAIQNRMYPQVKLYQPVLVPVTN